MADIPEGMPWGIIEGYFGAFLTDSSDEGRKPDAKGFNGTAKIEPANPDARWLRVTGLPGAGFFLVEDIDCVIEDGVLKTPGGDTGIPAIATVQPNALPNVVQWRITITIPDADVQIPSFVFNVPGDGQVVRLEEQLGTEEEAPYRTVVSESTRVLAELAAQRSKTDADRAEAAAEAAGAVEPVVGEDGKLLETVLPDELTPAGLSAQIAEQSTARVIAAGTATPAGRTAAAGPHPEFVPTGEIAWTRADTSLVSLYWPDVTDTLSDDWPGRYLFLSTTDHAAPGLSGIALAWGNTPTDPGPFSKLAIAGMPANLDQTETAQANLDTANGRIIVTFSAQNTANPGEQNTHVTALTRSAEGVTCTYLGEVAKFPSTDMGDGHGGYMGKLNPWGNALAAYTLDGGTTKRQYAMRATRDFLNWMPIGGQIATISGSGWVFPDWPAMRIFTWRGQRWAYLIATSTLPIDTYEHERRHYVARIADDLRTFLSEPVQILVGQLTDTHIQAIVADGDRLIGYYRNGGHLGDVRTAVAEG